MRADVLDGTATCVVVDFFRLRIAGAFDGGDGETEAETSPATLSSSSSSSTSTMEGVGCDAADDAAALPALLLTVDDDTASNACG